MTKVFPHADQVLQSPPLTVSIRDGYSRRKLNIVQSKRAKCQNVMDHVKSGVVRSSSRFVNNILNDLWK